MGNFFWSYCKNIPAGLGYGALYNWYAASNANFSPAGWHLPTFAELGTLQTYLGGNTVAGGKLKEVGLVHWETPNTGADNSTGFNGVGAGNRDYSSGVFSSITQIMRVWSTYDYSSSDGVVFNIRYDDDNFSSNFANKKQGCSIRLIKDDSTDPGTLTDYDGNVYNTVDINGQVWTASNWKCTKLNDGTAIPVEEDNTNWAALSTGAYCWYNNDIGNK